MITLIFYVLPMHATTFPKSRVSWFFRVSLHAGKIECVRRNSAITSNSPGTHTFLGLVKNPKKPRNPIFEKNATQDQATPDRQPAKKENGCRQPARIEAI